MANIEPRRERLRALLLEKAYLTGDFILSSGKHSNHYFDCRRVTLDPEGLALASELLIEKMRRDGLAAIGGLAIGADPLVAGVVATSWRLDYPIQGFIVRKEQKRHGTGRKIEGPPAAGTRVAIIDDVVTSGGSIIQAAESCLAEGLKPEAAYALVDREEGGAGEISRACGLGLKPLFKYSQLFA